MKNPLTYSLPGRLEIAALPLLRKGVNGKICRLEAGFRVVGSQDALTWKVEQDCRKGILHRAPTGEKDKRPSISTRYGLHVLRNARVTEDC